METINDGSGEKSFNRGVLYFALGVAVLIGLSSVFISFLPEKITGGNNKIALVEINGLITHSRDIVRQLSMYRKDHGIMGIVLRINSPGGAVAPSQEIYDEVLKIRNSGKKIFASLGSLAASGGYYIAAPANLVIANPGTLTGSIGVIMAFSNAEKLMEKIGIKPEVIKSGKYKDSGSPARPMSKQERRLLQNVVDDVHRQFVDAVAKGRNLPIKEVEKIADGRIFTGRQALELKLVDRMGGLADTIDFLAQKVGISGTPRIIQERPKLDLLTWLLQASISKYFMGSTPPQPLPTLQYLWPMGVPSL